MSDLARTFAKPAAKSQLATAPPLLEGEEDDSLSTSSASSVSSTGTIRPTSSQQQHQQSLISSLQSSTASESAITSSTNTLRIPHWSDFFAQDLHLERLADPATCTTHAKFHLYFTPPVDSKAPLFVCHHGAGSAALSFALFAREVRRQVPAAGIVSVEAREHGSVVWRQRGRHNEDHEEAEEGERSGELKANEKDEVDTELWLDNLSADFASAMALLKTKQKWTQFPSMVLVGHSLGGAVVADTAKKRLLGDRVVGYAVLDVVEGSAVDALRHMQAYLSGRPSTFPSPDAAIQWHLRSRTLRNPESAAASVPALLLPIRASPTIGDGPEAQEAPSTNSYRWRTDLNQTSTYWPNWFTGLSSKFLTARGAKLLILAGTDRLDKELTIGQMQGKFQMVVVPGAGHFVQEDEPVRTAEAVVEFWRRNDGSGLVLPMKVDEMIRLGKKV